MIGLVVLAGLVALAAPMAPAVAKYGAFPRKADGPVNLLLAGVTPQYDESAAVWPYPAKPEAYTGNTDTIILAQLWPDGRTKLLSIPRDSWMNVPGYGWGKINGANPHGGPDMLVNAVQALTGLRADGYALLSLRAVRDLTDAAGGVTVDVPQRMKYDDNAGKLHVDLQPGRQRLSGEQAEGFLRFRKDNLGDIGRVARQQLFLGALVNQVKSPLNWWRLPMVVSALDRNTKSNFTRDLSGKVLGAALSGPKVQMFKVPGDFGWAGNLSVWRVDQAALRALVQQEFRDPKDPRNLSVQVLNVQAPGGSARRMKARLDALGYVNVTTGNSAGVQGATTISGPGAARVRADLGFGQVTGEAGPGADVTVRLGADTPVN